MPAQLPTITPEYVPYLPSVHWGALAYDLLLDNAALGDSDILSCYGITQHQLDELQQNPRFQAVLAEAKQELDKLGENASFIARARALTENMLPAMFRRAMDAKTDTKDAHAIFKTFVGLSMLDPATNGTKNKVDDTQNTGGSFTLVLQGIPGMEHLQAKTIDAGQPAVIDVPQTATTGGGV
jgi:hypothetical protein